MPMLVMAVVRMGMVMDKLLMPMVVFMMFDQMQVQTEAHQARREQ